MTYAWPGRIGFGRTFVTKDRHGKVATSHTDIKDDEKIIGGIDGVGTSYGVEYHITFHDKSIHDPEHLTGPAVYVSQRRAKERAIALYQFWLKHPAKAVQ